MSSEAAPAANIVELWSGASQRLAAAMTAMAGKAPSAAATRPFDPSALFGSMSALMAGWAREPQQLFEMQAQAIGQWADFWTNAWRGELPDPQIPRSDRRFMDKQWSEDPAFRTVRDAYLLASNQLRTMVEATPEIAGSERAMVNFLLDQYLNAVAPSNFAVTNPEAVRRTIETGGANLAAGFANMLEDLSSGRGIVRRRTADTFRKGENIAATPGKVVFQNHLFQLIQYDPLTADVAAEPLLYVPPLVNRYYMIDLQPKSSLVRWLVEQGRTVFVISWVNPDERHAACGVDDYVRDGILAALDAVHGATGQKVNLFGFCLGGTLIALALGLLAARGGSDKVASATLIGSMVDFADMRDWSAFVHEGHLGALDNHLAKRGFIESDELQQLFSAVRANDLIWSSVVNHYLLDRDAPPSDLLYWFEDGARIPHAFLASYNRGLLKENRLRDPGGFAVDGTPIDLGQITVPMLVIALKEDHVSAWEAVYAGARLFGGPVEYILGGSGHNAGVINPPAANKHGYWRNPALPETAQAWLEGAEKHPGSWWPVWDGWLDEQGSCERVPARAPGTTGELAAIEPAPGSYALS